MDRICATATGPCHCAPLRSMPHTVGNIHVVILAVESNEAIWNTNPRTRTIPLPLVERLRHPYRAPWWYAIQAQSNTAANQLDTAADTSPSIAISLPLRVLESLRRHPIREAEKATRRNASSMRRSASCDRRSQALRQQCLRRHPTIREYADGSRTHPASVSVACLRVFWNPPNTHSRLRRGFAGSARATRNLLKQSRDPFVR